MKIENLEPTAVWQNFLKISAVPRPTGREQQVTAFMRDFGKNLNLETIVDEVGNVLIRKNGTKGKENAKPTAVQAHLDMVTVKDNGIAHDFDKDPIVPFIDGEWIKARGTTLGADNGIGVAAIMTILEAKNIKHGPIEALFTIGEEGGLDGAFAFKPGILKSDTLLNLDHTDSNEACIGSASAARVIAKINFQTTPVTGNNKVTFHLHLHGLKGGHSGDDIHLKRGNAIKILSDLLLEATTKFTLGLNMINGGIAFNAIPCESSATVVLPSQYEHDFASFVNNFVKTISQGFPFAKNELIIDITKTNNPLWVIDEKTQINLLQALYSCPDGILGMSLDIPGLVETSNNLAVINTDAQTIEIQLMQRSMRDYWTKVTRNMVENVFKLINAEISYGPSYGSWAPDPKSKALSLAKEAFLEKFGEELKAIAAHAGLECGIFKLAYPNLDMISIGPDIVHPHSTTEKVNIASVAKFWEFLVAIIER